MEPDVRASDAEREHTALALRDAAADGRLTLDELTERLDAAYGARTRGDLDRVVGDLGVAAAAPRPPARARRRVVSIMGGSDLRGRFRLERRLNVISVMGGTTIDLREAELVGRELTIDVVALMGGLAVIVPPGVAVDMRVIPIMGGAGHPRGTSTDPDAPVVRIRGVAIMGGVGVVVREPSRRRRALPADS